MTRYDPWVNALRSTVACFAAGMGGADAVTILPHDGLITVGGTSLGRRIARNTQTVLQMESNLARVDRPGRRVVVRRAADRPARRGGVGANCSGSKRAGGIVAAVTAGDRARIAGDGARRPATDAIARAQAAADRPDRVPRHPRDAAAARAGDRRSATTRPFAPLRLHRASAAVRTPARPCRPGRRADRHPTGRVPRHARHAGPVHGPGHVRQEPLRGGRHPHRRRSARRRSPAPGPTSPACARPTRCTAELAEAAAAELRSAGAERIYVAGRKLDLAGVDEEVGAGSDILDVLTRTLDAHAGQTLRGGIDEQSRDLSIPTHPESRRLRPRRRRADRIRRRVGGRRRRRDRAHRRRAGVEDARGHRRADHVRRVRPQGPRLPRLVPRVCRRTCGARTRRCTSTSRGRSGSTPGSPPPRTPTRSTAATSRPARRACRWRSTSRRTAATTATTRGCRRRRAWPAWRSTRSSTCASCSTASRSTR